MKKKIDFAFFGTPDLAVTVLEELKKEKLVPKLIVTAPDRPQGRGMKMSPSPVKVWADAHDIPTLQPEALDDSSFLKKLREQAWDVFVVAAYGAILPRAILDIPQHGILNVHPSLLPKYRGPSPIRTHILEDDPVCGVSIMLLDEKMDHGPLLAQTQIVIEKEDWPPYAKDLEAVLAEEGGKLLSYILPRWVSGKIEAQEQDHKKATYSSFITKKEAEIDLSGDPYRNLLKIRAYHASPRPYFFAEKNNKKIRVIITEASLNNGRLHIEKVIPEGRKEMAYRDFTESLPPQ